MTFDDFYDYLLNLCDKLSHETDEQTETIDELQYKLKCAVAANKSYIERTAKQTHEINALYKEIEQQKTEINRITMICEVKDDVAMDMRNELLELEKENKNLRKNIEYLCDENIRLRHELNEVKNHDRNY